MAERGRDRNRRKSKTTSRDDQVEDPLVDLIKRNYGLGDKSSDPVEGFHHSTPKELSEEECQVRRKKLLALASQLRFDENGEPNPLDLTKLVQEAIATKNELQEFTVPTKKPKFCHTKTDTRWEIFCFCLRSFCQNKRFFSFLNLYIFRETVYIFQFLNDKHTFLKKHTN